MPRPRSSQIEFVKRVADLRQDDGWNDRLSFHPAVFCQLALPYRTPPGAPPVWRRRNGPYVLTVRPSFATAEDGTEVPQYPTGTVPRLLLTWLATEVARQQEWERSREIQLGENLAHFMRSIGLGHMTGGKTGSITRLRSAMNCLFDAVITAEYEGDPSRDVGRNFVIADKKQLWWSTDDRNPAQQTLMPSTVWLSEPFYQHLRDHPVPVSFAGLRELQRFGSQPLDIYTWLCHRLSYLDQPRMDISWAQLRAQFGSTTADTRQGQWKFRTRFADNLNIVKQVYDEARVDVAEHGVILRPSPTHVRRKALPY